MRLTLAELETLAASAAELDGLALDIRMANSIGGRGEQWDAPKDKADHDRMKGLSEKLYAIREKGQRCTPR